MYWTIYRKLFIICFVAKFGLGTGVRITELNVPAWVDPRDSSLELSCGYDMGGEELYSVKWYKDEQEFFRYTPRQQPRVLAFPVAGVHLAPGVEPGPTARVRLTRLSTALSGGAYKCEVSTEAPQFRVAARQANVTVAAVGRAPPTLRGLHATYRAGDALSATCAAAAADPPPSLAWLVNGEPTAAAAAPRLSAPDAAGLVRAELELRLAARPPLFPLTLQCVAAPPPGVPLPPLVSAAAHATLDPPAPPAPRDVLGNQKLEWLNGTDRSFKINHWLSTLVIFLFFV